MSIYLLHTMASLLVSPDDRFANYYPNGQYTNECVLTELVTKLW